MTSKYAQLCRRRLCRQSRKEVSVENKGKARETNIKDFYEYRKLEEQLNALPYNLYFNVSSGMPLDRIQTKDGPKINYSTYNYVGLNGDPRVIEASCKAMERYGTSVSGSRMISGEILLHRELEEKIAEFLGTEDAIAFIGGYSTNVSAISTVLGKQDAVIHDSLAHNSIVTGCRLSGAKRLHFAHNDMDALEDLLQRIEGEYRRVLIVVEGIYSMDGDICNLPRLIELKKKYSALLMVDEAHSLGTIGDCGRGVGSWFNVDRSDVDLWMGTFSKSLSSCGGYISGSKEIVKFLKYVAQGFMFSCGITPGNAAAALKSLEILEESPELQVKLKKNSDLMLNLIKEKGLDTGLSADTPIIPCNFGNSQNCLLASGYLYQHGVNAMPIIYPAVSEKQARIRFFLSTLHTEEEIRETVDLLAEAVASTGEM